MSAEGRDDTGERSSAPWCPCKAVGESFGVWVMPGCYRDESVDRAREARHLAASGSRCREEIEPAPWACAPLVWTSVAAMHQPRGTWAAPWRRTSGGHPRCAMWRPRGPLRLSERYPHVLGGRFIGMCCEPRRGEAGFRSKVRRRRRALDAWRLPARRFEAMGVRARAAAVAASACLGVTQEELRSGRGTEDPQRARDKSWPGGVSREQSPRTFQSRPQQWATLKREGRKR